jgi:MFS transporter, DHA2 family, multidrug resistance protein
MVQTIYFNDRVSRFPGLVRVMLILILFAAMAQFASFGIIQAHVVSFYGAQPEDISFALQIAYAGVITTLPVQFRLVRYFNTLSYMLTAFLTGIVLNIGCLLVHDLLLFAVLRFFTGVVTCIIAGCLLISIFSTLPESKRMLVGVSLFFTLILTCGLIIGVGASWVVLRTNYTELYYGLIGLQVMAMLLCITVFRSKPGTRPYPLYQIDWAGCVLFMFGAVASLFVMVYGPKRYWFADVEIKYAAVFAVVALTLFLYRQATLKRPLIHLGVFKSGKFVFAILLMLLFWGLKDSINLIYGYAAVVLSWSSLDVVNAGLYNIAGVIIATFIAVKVIQAKKEKLPILLLTGFGVMFFYHLWVYFNLTPHLSFAQLCIPIFIQGFACGLLFVPISVFCMAMAPKNTGMTGIVILTYARFIATLNSIAGFYTLQLHYNQLFKISFLSKLAPDNGVVIQRQEVYKGMLTSKGYTPGEATGITNMLIAKASGMQSQLLTMRAVFYIIMILVLIVIVVLLLFAIINKIKAYGRSRIVA